MKKVAAYCRVSTDKDDQANSLENQKIYFDKYIKEKENWEFVGIYADEGISGTSTKNRDEFQKMIKDAYNGKIDIILVKEISRFFRNTPRLIDYIRDLKRNKVEVIFMTEGLTTFDDNNEFTISVLASTAQQESNKISTRTKWGQRISMERGVVFGNGLLGYDVKDGQLYINEKEADIVTEIFDYYTNKKMGMYLITRELINKGYKTRKGSTNWTPSAIRTILNNEKYVGDLKQQKTYTEDFLTHKTIINKGEQEFVYLKDHHEPIISRDLFDRTQKELETRCSAHKNSGNRYSSKYAFSGKIRCGHCGKKYSAGTKKVLKSGEEIMQWRCYTRATYGTEHILDNGEKLGCNGITIQDNVLKECFKKVFVEIIKNYPSIEQKAISMVTKIINRRCKNDDKEAKALKRKRELEKERDKLIELYVKELITEEEFREKKVERDRIIENISNELEHLKQKENILNNKNVIIDEVTKSIKGILQATDFNEEVFKEIVTEIVIHSRDEIDYYIKGIKDKFFFDTVGGFLYGKCGLIIKCYNIL